MIKIAVVGPESTGKSLTSQYLAEQYRTVWVPEYARAYCGRLSHPCTWQDEINMFRGQLALEKKMMSKADKLIFCDTMFLTVKIWSEKMFGKCPEEVLEMLPLHTYHFYLLMNIDLPWEYDPLRDFPNERAYFLNVWKKELDNLGAQYVLVSGLGEKRLHNALRATQDFLTKQTPAQ